MSEPFFSIILTAPFGFDSCIDLDSWLRELDDRAGEIIVVDSTAGTVDRGRGRIRHLRLPGETFIGLITKGVKEARGDWVLVSEDHCRPVAGIVDRYAETIARYPMAHLVSGRVENLTSRSPWSFAVFSIGLSEVWNQNSSPPRGASNANMLIRRSALRPEELETTGGVLMNAVPRLVRSAAMVVATGALVDHIVDLDGRNAADFVFECTHRSISQQRAINGPLTFFGDVSEAVQRWLGCAVVVPLTVARNHRGTPQAGLMNWLRVASICLRVAARLALADIRRLAARSASARQVPV
jgi:hypothetical protein